MDRRALWAVFRRRVTLVGLALSRIARRVTAAIIHRVRGCLSHRSHPPSDPLLPPLNGEIIKRAVMELLRESVAVEIRSQEKFEKILNHRAS